MKNLIILISIAAAAYLGYTKFIASSNTSLETYNTFTSLLNDNRYSQALEMAESNPVTEKSIKSRQSWFRFWRLERITQTLNNLISESISEDGSTMNIEINQKAWVVPGTTAPAFPDYVFKHKVILRKDESSQTGWIISEFQEEIETLGEK